MNFNEFLSKLEESASNNKIEKNPKPGQKDKFGINKVAWDPEKVSLPVTKSEIVGIFNGKEGSKPKDIYFIANKDFQNHYFGDDPSKIFYNAKYEIINIDGKKVVVYYHADNKTKAWRVNLAKNYVDTSAFNDYNFLEGRDIPVLVDNDEDSSIYGFAIVYNTNRKRDYIDQRKEMGRTASEAKSFYKGSGPWAVLADNGSFTMYNSFSEAFKDTAESISSNNEKKLAGVSDSKIRAAIKNKPSGFTSISALASAI